MGWISVKDRLPEKGTVVLGYVDNRYITTIPVIGMYANEKWIIDGRYDHEILNVTHWQYLPEPPKED